MVYIMGIGIGVNQIVGVDLGGLVSAADVILENMFYSQPIRCRFWCMVCLVDDQKKTPREADSRDYLYAAACIAANGHWFPSACYAWTQRLGGYRL